MWFHPEHSRSAARQEVRRRIFGGLATGAVVVGCVAAQALPDDRLPTATDVRLPPNLSAAAVFEPYLELMVRLSPTFRRQCERLGAAPSVKVQLQLEDPQRRPSFRARTVLERHQGVVVAAHIFLMPSPDTVELIAHEMEHVLEPFDGVDLQARVGSGHVWKREDGAFETRRAREVGLRVSREVLQRSNAHESAR